MDRRHFDPNGPSVDDYLVSFKPKDALRAIVQPPHPPVAAPRAIRGLLLEAGDILYDDTAWRRWLLRLLTRLGLRAEYGPFFRVFDGDYLADVHCGRQTFDAAMNAFLVSAGLSNGQADEACRALESHRRRAEAGYRPLIGVRQTLVQLRAAGVTLGLLSNNERSSDVLRSRLSEILGDSPWSAVTSSRDLGCAMPAATCYQSALAALKMPAGDVAFVGRDAKELRGAKILGLTTVAFNAEADAVADVHLQRFEELLELTRFSPVRYAA